MVQSAIYADPEEFVQRLGGQAVDTAVVVDLLLAASRQVDRWTNRFFGQTAAEARTFTAEHGDWLPVDDLASVTSLTTDENGDRVYETTWAGADYDLCPDNAATKGDPYTVVRTAPNGTRAFPTGRRGVRITGVWGWPEVPDVVREACLMQALRLYARRNAPYAIVSAAGGESRTIPGVDPDVRQMLQPYRRFAVLAV
jgi:hypothetical protein